MQRSYFSCYIYEIEKTNNFVDDIDFLASKMWR